MSQEMSDREMKGKELSCNYDITNHVKDYRRVAVKMAIG